jgi:mRNA interferase MazF
MVILQGDIFWVEFPPKRGSEPAGRRPAVIVQDDRWNRSQINTTIVLAITSNLKYAKLPGNVKLNKGEANLPKSCVINITQIKTIDKSYCIEKIGKLSPLRLKEVLEGLQMVFGLK